MTLKRLVAVLLTCVLLLGTGACQHMAARNVPQRVKDRFSNSEIADIEGVWLWNSGAVVVNELMADGTLVLTLIDCDDPTVETPLKIGYGRFGSKDNVFDLEMFTQKDAFSSKTTPGTVHILAQLTDNGYLSLTPYSKGIKLQLNRLLPYLFGIKISKESAPGPTNGAIRLYPRFGTPADPVIL